MNEDLNVAVSALVDGDTRAMSDASRTVEALVESRELRVRWGRYHLIRDVLRGDLKADVPVDLAARVRSAIDAEPAAFESVPLRPTPRRRARPQRVWALAASLAAVSALGVWLIEANGPSAAPDGPRVAVKHRLQRLATPLNPRYGLTFKRVNWNVPRPEVEARLNSYLANHSAYLSGGMHGILPYARVVAYDR